MVVRGPGGFLIGGQSPEGEPWWKTLLWMLAWLFCCFCLLVVTGVVLSWIGWI